MRRKRRTYDADFKKNAVELSYEKGRKVYEVEKSLGIPHGTLGRWRRELEENKDLAFPGNGNEALTEDQKRIRELERQLEDVKMDREILKKAVSIFSKAQK